MNSSHWIFYFLSFLLFVSVSFCLIRIIIGPSLPDRVVALDLTSYLLISIIAIYSLISKQAVYIDIVIALALIMFLGTVSFARYIEYQQKRQNKNKKKNQK